MRGILNVAAALVMLALNWAGPSDASQAGPDDPPVEQPPAVSVSLRDNRFRPARITVAAGTVVVWTNDESDETIEHNVISRDYRWASSNFLPGEAYERAFSAPGIYRYFCDLHGGMVGQVIVEG